MFCDKLCSSERKYLNTFYSSFTVPNCYHFTGDIFDCIYVKENFKIVIQVSLKFVPQGPIDNKSALVQVLGTDVGALGGHELNY